MQTHTPAGITASELFEKLKLARQSILLLDVRSGAEFSEQHIDGSINIPLDQLPSGFKAPDSSQELIVICRSGKRASKACEVLLGIGQQPKLLSGGLLSWLEAGLPTKKVTTRLSIERQTQLTIGIGVLIGVLAGSLVNRWFLIVPAFFGAGLTFAGASGTCGLAILLTKAPWNKQTGSTGSKTSGASCSN